MEVGTSDCDNSQRGASEGVSLATFASLLSVNLPVHLSVCLKAWQTPFTKETRVTCAVQWGKAAPKIWHADQPLTVFHQFQIIAPVKYGIPKYFIKAVLPTVIRLTAQSRSHYICLSLWLEFHFKCQVNSYFPEQSKDWTKKGKERHSWNKRGREITCQTVSAYWYFSTTWSLEKVTINLLIYKVSRWIHSRYHSRGGKIHLSREILGTFLQIRALNNIISSTPKSQQQAPTNLLQF